MWGAIKNQIAEYRCQFYFMIDTIHVTTFSLADFWPISKGTQILIIDDWHRVHIQALDYSIA